MIGCLKENTGTSVFSFKQPSEPYTHYRGKGNDVDIIVREEEKQKKILKITTEEHEDGERNNHYDERMFDNVAHT